MTYDNTYLITFIIEPLRTHTHTCSTDRAIVGSTGGRLLLESHGFRSSRSVSSMVAKRGPLRLIFKIWNSQKSLGARSGEYGGWVMTTMEVSQPWKTSNGMRRPNSRRFQKKPSAGASNNGRIDGANVCVRKGPTLKVIR